MSSCRVKPCLPPGLVSPRLWWRNHINLNQIPIQKGKHLTWIQINLAWHVTPVLLPSGKQWQSLLVCCTRAGLNRSHKVMVVFFLLWVVHWNREHIIITILIIIRDIPFTLLYWDGGKYLEDLSARPGFRADFSTWYIKLMFKEMNGVRVCSFNAYHNHTHTIVTHLPWKLINEAVTTQVSRMFARQEP